MRNNVNLSEPRFQLPPHWRGRLWNASTIRAAQPDWWIDTYGYGKWHQAGITGRGVVILVLDTGVDREHVERGDLAGQVVDVMSAIGGDGWDDNGHGTLCASTCSALKNGTGVLGVAPGATIVSVKCLDQSGSGSLGGILEAIGKGCDKALEIGMGRCLVNCSWGTGNQIPEVVESMQRWSQSGAVFHAAAGNGGQDNGVDWPGKSDLTCGWGAHDRDFRLADFSDRGNEVDAVAAGVDMRGATLNGQWTQWSGTSAACPHGVGAHALLWEAEMLAHGEVKTKTVEQWRAKLDAATVDLGTPGRDTGHGRGRIDADRLLATRDHPPATGTKWATKVIDGEPVYVPI